MTNLTYPSMEHGTEQAPTYLVPVKVAVFGDVTL